MVKALIGTNLANSFSKEIHEAIDNSNYDLIELKESDLASFMKNKSFDLLNITTPFKEEVIKYLDDQSDSVKITGVCNTIINCNGHLTGYNTDIDGFKYLLEKSGFDFSSKKVLILGTGATSKTASFVLKSLGAFVYHASRKAVKGILSYDELKNKRQDFEVIVNTTIVGRSSNQTHLVDLDNFPNLKLAIDVNFNPFNSWLILFAKTHNIASIGGLWMLIYQAVVAEELLGKRIDEKTLEKIYRNIYKKHQNILLIGMSYSGKSSFAKELAEKFGNRIVVDFDDIIEKNEKMQIKDIFSSKGEVYFRKKEEKLADSIWFKLNYIFVPGAGIVENEKAMALLKSNAVCIYLDNESIPHLDDSRPLLKDEASYLLLKEKRKPLYLKYADYVISGDTNKIRKELFTLYEKDFNC